MTKRADVVNLDLLVFHRDQFAIGILNFHFFVGLEEENLVLFPTEPTGGHLDLAEYVPLFKENHITGKRYRHSKQAP